MDLVGLSETRIIETGIETVAEPNHDLLAVGDGPGQGAADPYFEPTVSMR